MSAPTATTFGYTAKIVSFTIPATGFYDIIVFGAQGGSSSAKTGGIATGGLGAKVSADFRLQAGTKLEILVGGEGGVASGGLGRIGTGGGGGGGSFVAAVNGPNPPIPLVVAAGGGGADSVALSQAANGTPGAIASQGTPGLGAKSGVGGGDGSGGDGGSFFLFGAGGGGGFSGNGHAGDNGTSAGGNGFSATLNGATQAYAGGFGGGGEGGLLSGGGGGGFSGGGGGGLFGGGGGGGSFFANFATATTLTANIGLADGLIEIDPICFLAGTRIATTAGEVAVEHLRIGDCVLTVQGRTRAIVWIGQGRVLATPGQRTAAATVIIRKDALGDDCPRRDLHVTKGHCLFVDGGLIPAEFLVNYRSIVWNERAGEIEVYHVELEAHDVLLADGAPAESYRDDGNRWLFWNANETWSLPPQEPCAPILTGGPIVDAAWRRLLDRAGAGPDLELTDDPDLHLLVDGTRLNAAVIHPGGVHTFRLPATLGTVCIASRAAAPAALGLSRDSRALGVAISKAAVWKGAYLSLIEAKDGRLGRGFHGYEPELGWRWTDGHAMLPVQLFAGIDGPLELDLHVAAKARYPLAAPAARLRTAA